MKLRLRSKGWGLFSLIVLLPLLVGCVYYAVFAVDRFESSARVVVRHAGASEAPTSAGLAILLSGLNPASREETLYLSEYIRSSDMLKILDEELGWTKHYADQVRDPLYWLAEDAAIETKLKFYHRVVDVFFDEATGLLQVRVQALSPEYAEKVLDLILSRGEALVNELSHRMGRDQVRFAQSELLIARRSYEDNNAKLLKFQREKNILDLEATVSSRSSIVSTIEAELASERAALSGLRASLNAAAPQVRQKEVRIKALERQLALENSKLVATREGGNGNQLNVAASEYRNLMLDASIAEEIYKLAINAVEGARIESSKKIRSLMVIVSPNLPDDPTYPRRLYNLATLLLCSLLIYGVARFVLATIEDHRD